MTVLFIVSLIGLIPFLHILYDTKEQELEFLDYYFLLLFPGIAFMFSVGGILYCIGVIFGILTIK